MFLLRQCAVRVRQNNNRKRRRRSTSGFWQRSDTDDPVGRYESLDRTLKRTEACDGSWKDPSLIGTEPNRSGAFLLRGSGRSHDGNAGNPPLRIRGGWAQDRGKDGNVSSDPAAVGFLLARLR